MTLEIITGPMFSGKSTELIRMIKREGYAKKGIGLFKPAVDNRYSEDDVITHDGLKYPTFKIPTTKEGVESISKIVMDGNLKAIGIDEIQFFPDDIIELCEMLADKIKVIVTGLNLDFRGEPFKVVSEILPRADRILHLTAICAVCGENATRTQRLVDGKPADYDSPVIVVGGKELYEARCRKHHEINKI